MIKFQINNNLLQQNNLEKYILKYFSIKSSSHFLQELMFLGFEYASKYSFSLNLESFKSYIYLFPLITKNENLKLTYLWSYWNSNINYFENNFKSNLLFNNFFKFINTYKQINPITNSLHLMINTGAKANWIQCLQLIGIRGYLSNSKGTLYNIPIMQNFGKGLKLYEYFISCYGARKGILDTSIKTADSGYLTRRVLEVSRDVVIKEYFWGTNSSFFCDFILDIYGNLIYPDSILEGKFLIYKLNKNLSNLFKNKKNLLITKFVINYIFNLNLKLNFRGLLNCQAGRNICNTCYGYKISNKINNIGESIGILAAQTIGEPATQLTLRTFHTGGVFTNLTKDITFNLLKKSSFRNYNLNSNFKILSFKSKYNLNYFVNKSKIIQDSFLSFCLNNKGILINTQTNVFKNDFFKFINLTNTTLIYSKTLNNIKKYINLKFNFAYFNKFNTIYKQNQKILLNLFNNNFNKTLNSQKYFKFIESKQIFNHKTIYFLHKNVNNKWLVKNLNNNIIYNKNILTKLLLNKSKIYIFNNNKYLNLIKIKNINISKISFLENFYNYIILKSKFKKQYSIYKQQNLNTLNKFNYFINSKGYYFN
uniref:DNA-directed RNA polymerase n=1 Tax=Nephromyces sp. ex Molgula occidentalis TaxID=2544991 RepID=A0A5C1H8Q2_9APIC|nr:plastid-encoded DNA-directed RNA polymerase beta''A [Nephromyces sp. ex Molgula occidentalis]